MTDPRYCGEKFQGEDEALPYTFDWAAEGTPVTAAVAIKDEALTDKSATLITGAASIVADTVITGIVAGLTAGQSYRLECKITIGGSTYEAYLVIHAQE